MATARATEAHSAARAVLSEERRDVLTGRVRMFVAATITYNVLEAVIALSAGVRANSTALIGFGLDSVIEVSSAAAVAWQFSAPDHATREAREHRALRVIALSFFALAAYVGVESLRALAGTGQAGASRTGLVLAAVSLLVMPLLSAAQRRAGRELGSASAVADSKQTLLCTYLSAVLLVGLGVNAVFGWSWADPIAALVIAAIAVKEGLQAWRGEGCCAPGAALHPHDAAASAGKSDGGTDRCCTSPSPAVQPDQRAHLAPVETTGLALTVKGASTPRAQPGSGDEGCTDGCCGGRG